MIEARNALVLIVEDDKRLSHINRHALESEGYKVKAAYTLAGARLLLKSISPDVILLDVKLPDGSGFDLCREIREITRAYIIFLTSVTTSSGELEGLTSGGDDYLRKPYSIELLCERVKKGLRHAMPAQQIQKGSLMIDMVSGQVFLSGKDIPLSPKEFKLISILMQNEGELIDMEYLYEKAWGQPLCGSTGALTTMIYRIRKKIKGSGYDIVAQRGQGYVFETD